MEIIVYVLLAVSVAWAGYAGWTNYRLSCDLRRAMEMLAARSFGEFASGKARIEGKTPVEDSIDLGFN
jgi:hypothetical protein